MKNGCIVWTEKDKIMQWHFVENKIQIMQHVLNAANVLVVYIYKMKGFLMLVHMCEWRCLEG